MEEEEKRKTIQEIEELIASGKLSNSTGRDRFGVASLLVDEFLMDFIQGTNSGEFSVDEIFQDLNLSKSYYENLCGEINDKVNPFVDPKQLGHNATKKIIYKAILTMVWEQELPDADDLGELR
tara:strand:+ start:6270 stop:6638 length:369 start_codon:yes stop_codon:yes gene_type:complete